MTELEEALKNYPFQNAKAEFIRHNENITYCVDNKYLLRIHRPVEGFSLSLLTEGSPVSHRQNEMAFLKELSGLCDIPLQQPVANHAGKLVSLLSDGTPVTVLTWLEGSTPEKDFFTVERCRELGAMIGKFHLASEKSEAGRQGGIRYDGNLCRRLAEQIGKAELTEPQSKCFTAILEKIGGFLDEQENTRPFFRVHADLSPANLLITSQGIAPIDFSLSGLSHWAMDLGSVCSYLPDYAQQKAVEKGYEEMTGIHPDRQEGNLFFAIQTLLFIVCQFDRFKGEEWFQKGLDRWCGDIFQPILDGKDALAEQAG